MNLIDIFLEDTVKSNHSNPSNLKSDINGEEGLRIVEFEGCAPSQTVLDSLSEKKFLQLRLRSVQEITDSLLYKDTFYSTVVAVIRSSTAQIPALLAEASRSGIHVALLQLTDTITPEVETVLGRNLEKGIAVVLVK
ncbi:MAG: hypothetical protein K2Q26_11380 [Bdellovibrionales bacterium]|nr:hypothetical protein [Bdellovibrionales bacterium]